MQFHSPNPSPSPPRATRTNYASHGESHYVSMLRPYFARFGLTDPTAAVAAARRVVAAVASEHLPPSERDRRLIVVARDWIREFAETTPGAGDHDWFWRAPSLLSRFPGAFLATPVPAGASRKARSS